MLKQAPSDTFLRIPDDPDLKAVTFDVGGTLIEPWPSVGYLYAEVAAAQGEAGLDPGLLDRRFHEAWANRGGFDYSEAAWRDLVDRVFAGLVATPPSRSFFPRLWERFARREAWRVYDWVRGTLAELAGRGLRLGVISNWDVRLRPLLGELDLAGAFETMVVSCEVGATKPSPVIFAETARRLGLAPGAILHVGDSAMEDEAGARAAGFRAMRVRRPR